MGSTLTTHELTTELRTLRDRLRGTQNALRLPAPQQRPAQRGGAGAGSGRRHRAYGVRLPRARAQHSIALGLPKLLWHSYGTMLLNEPNPELFCFSWYGAASMSYGHVFMLRLWFMQHDAWFLFYKCSVGMSAIAYALLAGEVVSHKGFSNHSLLAMSNNHMALEWYSKMLVLPPMVYFWEASG